MKKSGTCERKFPQFKSFGYENKIKINDILPDTLEKEPWIFIVSSNVLDWLYYDKQSLNT